MWEKSIVRVGIVFFLAIFLFWGCATVKVKEQKSTITHKDTAIEVTTYGDVEVTKVEPEVKIKKGEKKGNLNVEVELKNTGTKPDRYNVFASGVSKEGISEGGNLTIPQKVFLKPGEKAKGKIKTRFRGEGLPSTVILEVYSLADIGYEPDPLETLFEE
jgi:hypothetical protein